MLVVGCSAPKQRVDHGYLMAGTHTLYAYINILIAGIYPISGSRDILPLLEELRRFNTTFSRQLWHMFCLCAPTHLLAVRQIKSLLIFHLI